MDLAHKSSRVKLTCGECARRKIKCDKRIPCNNCIKRGIEAACSRDSARPDERPVQSSTEVNHEPVRSSELIQTLLGRVSQLETLLQQSAATHDPPPVTHRPEPGIGPAVRHAAEDAQAIDTPEADVVSILEFMAWGRKKHHSFHEAPENDSGPRRHGTTAPDQARETSTFLTENITSTQLDVLEALLPSRTHIHQLVHFHHNLVWYHGSYSTIVFNDELELFFSEYQGSIRHKDLNLQWLGLLYAILTGGLTCASASTLRSWGFSEAERATLSVQWYNATKTCLQLADYMEVHTIYSVQAIATLTISAHILGFSNSQSILLASANRIAQALNLHRLGPDVDVASMERLRRRETGRRVWTQLCSQDWFSVPFTETYSLNPKFFQTAKPLNCNDIDMIVHPPSTPTQTSYCNYLYEIALLMPQLQDAMAASNTLYTKYEQVLKYDDKMRKLATAYMPTFLSTSSPVSADWPVYIGWARRSLAICAAHKIIMIHRKFLGLSFTNSAFSFTRRTCIAAAKTILKEAQSASDEHGPVLWIDQAFTVAAGIILSLDAFHREPDEADFEEQRKHVSDSIEYLRTFESSKLAARGIQLLSFMLQELNSAASLASSRKRSAPGDVAQTERPEKRQRFDLSALVRNISHDLRGRTQEDPDTEDAAELAWDAFVDLLPPQTGFGAENMFDDFFSAEVR